MTQKNKVSVLMRTLAVFAFLFGIVTLYKSGNVLFGPQSARDAVGNFVPFVVWFNFFAGFLYVAVAVHIWLGRSCALRGALVIAATTSLVAGFFAWHVMSGGLFEMQTVGALAIRTGFWSVVAVLLYRR